MKVDVKKIVLESIDLEKLAFAVIDEVVEPAIKEAVEKSATPIDNAVVDLLYPVVEVEAKKKISELVAKLKAE